MPGTAVLTWSHIRLPSRLETAQTKERQRCMALVNNVNVTYLTDGPEVLAFLDGGAAISRPDFVFFVMIVPSETEMCNCRANSGVAGDQCFKSGWKAADKQITTFEALTSCSGARYLASVPPYWPSTFEAAFCHHSPPSQSRMSLIYAQSRYQRVQCYVKRRMSRLGHGYTEYIDVCFT